MKISTITATVHIEGDVPKEILELIENDLNEIIGISVQEYYYEVAENAENICTSTEIKENITCQEA